MVHGRISKARLNVSLTANYIKLALGLSLSPADLEFEKAVNP